MINKNDELVLECIKTLTNSASKAEAIKFVEHNQTCYNIAMAVAQAKDERIKELEVTLNCRSKYERIYRDEFLKTEKQSLIDKACEWLRLNVESDKYLSPDEESYRMGCGVDYLETNMFIEDFKNYMKEGEE